MKIRWFELKPMIKRFEQLFFKQTGTDKREVKRKAVFWAAVSVLVFVTFWLGYFHKAAKLDLLKAIGVLGLKLQENRNEI